MYVFQVLFCYTFSLTRSTSCPMIHSSLHLRILFSSLLCESLIDFFPSYEQHLSYTETQMLFLKRCLDTIQCFHFPPHAWVVTPSWLEGLSQVFGEALFSGGCCAFQALWKDLLLLGKLDFLNAPHHQLFWDLKMFVLEDVHIIMHALVFLL